MRLAGARRCFHDRPTSPRPSFLVATLDWLYLARRCVKEISSYYMESHKSSTDARKAAQAALHRFCSAALSRLEVTLTVEGSSNIYKFDQSRPIVFVWLNQTSLFESIAFPYALPDRPFPWFFLANPAFLLIPIFGWFFFGPLRAQPVIRQHRKLAISSLDRAIERHASSPSPSFPSPLSGFEREKISEFQ